MLSRLYVDNYNSLVDFELKLSELTVLIGRNGSGKSSVIDVLFAVRELLSGRGRVADLFASRSLTRWAEVRVQTIELDAHLDGDSFRYRLELEHAPERSLVRVHMESLHANERPLFHFSQGKVQLHRDDHSEGPSFDGDWSESALARVAPGPSNARLTRFLEFMGRMFVCHLSPSSFEAEARSEDPVLHRSGQNFAAWYRHAIQEHPELVPSLHAALEEAIPRFRSMRLERVGRDARAVAVVFETDAHRFELQLDELSDGERALIANYALITMTAGQGAALFLDEAENHLALREIQPWLVALEEACGDTIPQAVISSHHPELLDYFGPGRCTLLVRNESGATRTGCFAEISADGGLKLSELVARGWEA